MTDHVTAPSILLVTTGQPGPARNGRPGCKLHPVARADVPAAWIAGSFCIKTALACLSSGNDEPKNRLLSRRLAAFEHNDLDFAGPLLRLQQCELVAPKTLYAADEWMHHGAIAGRASLGKIHESINATSVRGGCPVCNSRLRADRTSRAGVQSRQWWNRRRRQFRVCRSGRAGQHVRLRPGPATNGLERVSTKQSPAGSIQVLPP